MSYNNNNGDENEKEEGEVDSDSGVNTDAYWAHGVLGTLSRYQALFWVLYNSYNSITR